MHKLCVKHNLNPKVMRSFIDETIRLINLNESAKKSDPQFKMMKPYIEAVKDLLKNGDIKEEE